MILFSKYSASKLYFMYNTSLSQYLCLQLFPMYSTKELENTSVDY